jgi:hypothetical protein
MGALADTTGLLLALPRDLEMTNGNPLSPEERSCSDVTGLTESDPERNVEQLRSDGRPRSHKAAASVLHQMRSMLAARTTPAHFATSATTRALNSSGVEDLGLLPNFLRRSTISGSGNVGF